MSEWSNSFPESQAMPPQLPGEVPYTSRVLPTLRLAQLRDLARAYGVQINMNGTKNQILPALMAAEQEGTFRQQPKLPYYRARAERTTDTRHFDLPYFENPDGVEQKPVVVEEVSDEPLDTDTASVKDMKTYLATFLDFDGKPRYNTFGVTREFVVECVKKEQADADSGT